VSGKCRVKKMAHDFHSPVCSFMNYYMLHHIASRRDDTQDYLTIILKYSNQLFENASKFGWPQMASFRF
jgi:hypothetical protein